MILKKMHWFQIFKYTVFTAVFINVFLFLRKEFAAGAHRFTEGINFENFIEAFTQTIDTGAWVILLLLFELETYVIPRQKLKGGLELSFQLIRGFCYMVIISSFWGYCNNLLWLSNFQLSDLQNLCDVKAQSWMLKLDEFATITGDNCSNLPKEGAFYKFSTKDIFTDNATLNSAFWLGFVEALNSFSWILVVIILEIDVWLKLRNRFKGMTSQISKYLKNGLYILLLAIAVYWGVYSDFLDFWDAFLWIVAFFFIEMNLFDWKSEVDEKAKD